MKIQKIEKFINLIIFKHKILQIISNVNKFSNYNNKKLIEMINNNNYITIIMQNVELLFIQSLLIINKSKMIFKMFKNKLT